MTSEKMVTKRDYYEVLQVSRTASDNEISESYRKLALQYHPDRNPGDDDAISKFKEAAEAFEVLHHAEKRACYDRYGHAGLEGAGGSPHFHDIRDIFDSFGDLFGNGGGAGGIFGDLFGGGARRGGKRVHRGADVRCQVTLELTEVAVETTRKVGFSRKETCDECKGSGAKPGTQPETCTYCGGTGQVVQSTGIFSVQMACPACRGIGSIIKHPCQQCRGVGLVSKKVTRSVRIPAGMDDQTRLRLPGEGDFSPDGGPPGDCYCYISVKQHPLFHRDGQHLICNVPITYSQASLGATIEVPTIDGCQPLTIQSGTHSGDVFKLRGKGMPDPRRHGRGDLHVQIQIEVPKRISGEHEELLRKLAEIEHVDVTPKRKGFLQKIKEVFSTDAEQEKTKE